MHTQPAEPRPSVFWNTGTNTLPMVQLWVMKTHTQFGLCLLETNVNESRDNKDTQEQGLCAARCLSPAVRPSGSTGKGLAQRLRSVGLLPPPYFLISSHFCTV